uniref:Uncharacterized protein n=1 Tax=Arundo donax TaxID=35708 RepID=A0A0A9E4B0_ARUDO
MCFDFRMRFFLIFNGVKFGVFWWGISAKF